MLQEGFLGNKLEWPKPYRCAVTFVFNFQGAEGLQPGPNGRVEYEVFTKREYGPRAGIWRILRTLKKHDVRATFVVCGGIAERYPDAVRAVHADGHEIGGHGYHHEIAWKLSREEERETIAKTIDILRDVTGDTIRGWRTCTQSENTPELLLERGLLWNSNSFNYDLPYLLRDGNRTIVEIPRQPFGDGLLYGGDDFGNPADAFDAWRRAFDTFYEESAHAPTFCPFSMHPYISGRPGRAQALSELISYIQGHEGVWLATCEEIARTVLECAGRPDLVAAGASQR